MVYTWTNFCRKFPLLETFKYCRIIEAYSEAPNRSVRSCKPNLAERELISAHKAVLWAPRTSLIGDSFLF